MKLWFKQLFCFHDYLITDSFSTMVSWRTFYKCSKCDKEYSKGASAYD